MGVQIVCEPMSLLELADAREHSSFSQTHLKKHVFSQSARIGSVRYAREFQQRFNLRCENKLVFKDRVIKRFDPKRIACRKQLVFLNIVNDKGEHPVQLTHAVFAVFGVEMKDHFSIRRRLKPVAFGGKHGAKLDIVVNLAVENDP